MSNHSGFCSSKRGDDGDGVNWNSIRIWVQCSSQVTITCTPTLSFPQARCHSSPIFICSGFCLIFVYNWTALWKNWISSTSMKLRKSLVKPVTRQNISNCSVLSPEIVMHDTFSVSLWTSADICVVVHEDLGWKNQTTRCNRFWKAGCSRLEYVNIRLIY